MKYIAFASGGKDSTCMIEKLIEGQYPLDLIVFIKVDKEFSLESSFREKLIQRWTPYAECKVLQTQDTWDRWFYGEITRGERKGLKRGFPLHGRPCWWTREAKVKVIENFLKTRADEVTQYIGYTTNETANQRIKIKQDYLQGKRDKHYKYPLIDWNLTEEQCRQFCNERNILNPMYKYFERAGCYLCPNQERNTLITLCQHFPTEWKELLAYCESTLSDNFVKPGGFNRRVNLQDLQEIDRQYYKEDITCK